MTVFLCLCVVVFALGMGFVSWRCAHLQKLLKAYHSQKNYVTPPPGRYTVLRVYGFLNRFFQDPQPEHVPEEGLAILLDAKEVQYYLRFSQKELEVPQFWGHTVVYISYTTDGRLRITSD